jgi:hypothetical protein
VSPLIQEYFGNNRPTLIYSFFYYFNILALHDYTSETWTQISLKELKDFGINLDKAYDDNLNKIGDVVTISRYLKLLKF